VFRACSSVVRAAGS